MPIIFIFLGVSFLTTIAVHQVILQFILVNNKNAILNFSKGKEKKKRDVGHTHRNALWYFMHWFRWIKIEYIKQIYL